MSNNRLIQWKKNYICKVLFFTLQKNTFIYDENVILFANNDIITQNI